MLLGSSGTLEGITKLAARFFFSEPEKIAFIPRGNEKNAWTVFNGSKGTLVMMVKKGARYRLQRANEA